MATPSSNGKEGGKGMPLAGNDPIMLDAIPKLLPTNGSDVHVTQAKLLVILDAQAPNAKAGGRGLIPPVAIRIALDRCRIRVAARPCPSSSGLPVTGEPSPPPAAAMSGRCARAGGRIAPTRTRRLLAAVTPHASRCSGPILAA